MSAPIGGAADTPGQHESSRSLAFLRTVDRSALAYAILLLLGGLDSAGYAMIGPVLPGLARSTHAGPLVAGTVVAGFPVGMLFGFAAAGSAIRRLGSRPTLIAALLVVAGGTVGFIASSAIAEFVAARVTMGFGSGGLWLGVTFSTLERWPGQEYLCMSRIYAAFSVGALVGPALGALGGVTAPFIAYLALVAVGCALAVVLPAPHQRRAFDSDRGELRRPGFWVAAVGIMLAILGTGLVDGVLPIHFSHHLSQAQIGGTYAALAIVVALSSAGAGRITPGRAMAAGAGLLIVGIELAGASNGVSAWLGALAVVGIGIGISQTGATGLLLDVVPTERIVSAMVVWSQMGIVGYLIAPIAGGELGQTLGYQALGLIPAAMAALLIAANLCARKHAADAQR